MALKQPGRSEFSHGKGLAGNPDSDYQSQRKLMWEVAERDQGSKRGGYTASMKMQAEKRMDSTVVNETDESMLYALGNPDAFGPGPKIVQEAAVRPSGQYRIPEVRYKVTREE